MGQFTSPHVTTYVMELNQIKEVTGCVSGRNDKHFVGIIAQSVQSLGYGIDSFSMWVSFQVFAQSFLFLAVSAAHPDL
jgi:hypothetical protein